MTDALDAFEAQLEQHLAFIRESARDAAGWASASAYYGLSHTTPPAGPAPVDQVRTALRVLSLRAASELESVGVDDVDRERLERAWDRVACLVDVESRAYAESIRPSGKLGLGGIFQNATASVGTHWWSDLKYDVRITLLCRSCGAPQEKTRDFKCGYCGGDLFRRPNDAPTTEPA